MHTRGDQPNQGNITKLPCMQYQQKMNRLDVKAKLFAEISLDMLGEIKIKPFPTISTVCKNYPLIIKCINSVAVTVLMMEESKTKDIILALLRLDGDRSI